jgi:adenylate cyclase
MPAASEPRRKLAAILSADAVGYSRLMQADEPATVETLNAYRAAMRRVIERHQGRVVNAPGDALLAEFGSVIGAVSAAVEIQQDLEGRNMELAPERRMHFRIGVNLGDVIEQEDGTIYGDGVNIAARMEALAEGGAVCVSSTVYDAVEGKLALGFDFLGEQQVKNIARPVRVYRVRSENRSKGAPPKAARRKWLWPAVAGVVLIGAIIGVGLWRYGDRAAMSTEDPILALPKGPSIAVLPFTNLSGDPAQDYFSDGLTEQLITALARYNGLYVIARNSTFQYKRQAVDVRKVGRELGARYVLEGSVRRSGERLRVTAQLLDAQTGAHLWADTYDRALTGTDIFALQDDITSRAVANIAGPHGRIAQTGLKETKGKAPDTIDSYDCVLRAVAYSRVMSAEGHAPVRDCLERAIARDPDYAEAWAWLAYAYLMEYDPGLNPRPELYDARDQALRAALRAVDLDPNIGIVHSNLSYVRFLRHEVDASLASAERGVGLNPNDPEVLCNAGQFIAFAGNWERGIALTKKAMALSPYYPTWCHFQLSDYHYIRGE